MYVASFCIAATLNTYPASCAKNISYVFLCSLFPNIFLRNLTWVPSTILVISSNMDQTYVPKNRTTCTTTQYNTANTRVSAPSSRSIFPIRPQTFCALLMFRKIECRLLSDWSKGIPRYLNCVTPSTRSSSSIPYRLKSISRDIWSKSTSLCCNHTYAARLHLYVFLFWSKMESDIFIPQLVLRGSGVQQYHSKATLEFVYLRSGLWKLFHSIFLLSLDCCILLS